MRDAAVRALVAYCTRRPFLIVGAVAALTTGAVALATQVPFESSIEIWFDDGDPAVERYRRFLALFECEERVVLAYETEDACAAENIRRLQRLENAIAALPHVCRVTSLASAVVPRAQGDALVVGPLFDPWPASPAEWAARRRAARASPLLNATLLMADGRATVLLVELEQVAGGFEHKRALLAALETILADEAARDGVRIVAAGTAVLDRAFFDYAQRDMTVFGPVFFLVMCLAIFLLFRRLFVVLIPIAVVAAALAVTLGVQALLGWKTNVISTILAPLLMAVGVADALHVITEYLEALGRGDAAGVAVSRAVERVWRPCLFTSLTTAAGFLSLLVSDIAPVRQVGLLASVGVVAAFGLTLTLVPAALTWVSPPPVASLVRQREGPIGRLLALLGRGGTRHDWITVGVGGGLVLAGVLGATQVEIGTNTLEFLRTDDPVRRDIEYVDRLAGGTVTLEFLIEANRERGLAEPDRLARLARFGEFLAKQPNVTGVSSPVILFEELDAAVRGLPPDRGTLPDSTELAAQYLLLLESSEALEQVVQDGGGVGRLSARARMTDYARLSMRVPEIDAHAQATVAGNGMRVSSTGRVALLSDIERYLLRSQLRSFGLAFVVVTVMMIVLLGSARLGLFGMIPNLAPLVLTGGVMGLAGIRLDTGTVMIASITLGLVVDDTIHTLARLQRELGRPGADLDQALARTVTSVGRPILATSVVLALGFWTLLLASFAPNINFGLLSGVTILTALIADLVLLPAVLRLVRPRLTATPRSSTAITDGDTDGAPPTVGSPASR